MFPEVVLAFVTVIDQLPVARIRVMPPNNCLLKLINPKKCSAFK